MNLIYGHKCKKNIVNNKYDVGTPEYRKCVLRKGLNNLMNKIRQNQIIQNIAKIYSYNFTLCFSFK